jgi:hypothetical protein
MLVTWIPASVATVVIVDPRAATPAAPPRLEMLESRSLYPQPHPKARLEKGQGA